MSPEARLDCDLMTDSLLHEIPEVIKTLETLLSSHFLVLSKVGLNLLDGVLHLVALGNRLLVSGVLLPQHVHDVGELLGSHGLLPLELHLRLSVGILIPEVRLLAQGFLEVKVMRMDFVAILNIQDVELGILPNIVSFLHFGMIRRDVLSILEGQQVYFLD